MLKSERISATLKLLPNTNLVEMNIAVHEKSNKARTHHWQPGQHGYVSLPGQRILRSNPFSVASLQHTDGQLRFVARILDGNTAVLARAAESAKVTRQLKIEGPYGVSSHSEKLLNYDRVLFVAGGVGGTFMVPLYRQLLADLSPSKGSRRRQKVAFLWIARSVADLAWALPEDNGDREGIIERLKVYVTGESSGNLAHATQTSAETNEGIEMEERKNLLSEESNDLHEKAESGLSVTAGRPDLKRLVDETFSQNVSDRVAVLVCGPKTLSRSLRRELRRWGEKGRDIWYWEEEFAL